MIEGATIALAIVNVVGCLWAWHDLGLDHRR